MFLGTTMPPPGSSIQVQAGLATGAEENREGLLVTADPCPQPSPPAGPAGGPAHVPPLPPGKVERLALGLTEASHINGPLIFALSVIALSKLAPRQTRAVSREGRWRPVRLR